MTHEEADYYRCAGEIEVLDFAGPFEVLSRVRLKPGVDSRRSDTSAPFDLFTVAPTMGPIAATGGLIVQPVYSFANAPPIDVLVIPGQFRDAPSPERRTS